MIKKVSFLLISILLLSCSVGREIIDKPIVFNDERIALTKAYMEKRYDLPTESIVIEPKMIVLHWTAIPTLEGSFDAFYNSTLPSWRPDIETVSGLNVSSHFLVDQDGTIYRLMPENYMARHVIGLNHTAIGVENVGGTDDKPLTEAQLEANIKLVRYLAQKYAIEYLIGHYEYTLFEGHPLWLEKDVAYRTTKVDPGADFMLKVRAATKKFNFKNVPEKIVE